MELIFLALLIILMAWALGVGFPVAFALPGSAIITISLAAVFAITMAIQFVSYFLDAVADCREEPGKRLPEAPSAY